MCAGVSFFIPMTRTHALDAETFWHRGNVSLSPGGSKPCCPSSNRPQSLASCASHRRRLFRSASTPATYRFVGNTLGSYSSNEITKNQRGRKMDGYRDGAKNGAARAEVGKNRSFRPATIGQFVKMLASDQYRKTHAEGTRDGYRDQNLKR